MWLKIIFQKQNTNKQKNDDTSWILSFEQSLPSWPSDLSTEEIN